MLTTPFCEEDTKPLWILDDTPPESVSETLMYREQSYGNYATGSGIAQNIKRALSDTSGWDTLSDTQRSSLEMIAFKISRILNGDPNHADSWRDIAGYAQLIVNELTT